MYWFHLLHRFVLVMRFFSGSSSWSVADIFHSFCSADFCALTVFPSFIKVSLSCQTLVFWCTVFSPAKAAMFWFLCCLSLSIFYFLDRIFCFFSTFAMKPFPYVLTYLSIFIRFITSFTDWFVFLAQKFDYILLSVIHVPNFDTISSVGVVFEFTVFKFA